MSCQSVLKDNEQQVSPSKALFALLHELFTREQYRVRFALNDLESNPEKIIAEATTFVAYPAPAGYGAKGPVVCVLDALYECLDADRRQYIEISMQIP